MSETTVRISSGFLKGAIKKNIDEKPFFSFEGIPFAEPPLGPLRFKAPVPVKPWEGIRDALSKGSSNYSLDFVQKQTETGEIIYTKELIGGEDCLYLNVYTPTLPHDQYELKPVMFFIHGGAFCSGSSHIYGSEVILTEDVVLVTIHYRYGALGFLALDDPELGATGNAGMKDMVLALKWVQKNIKTFNGDPNNVTIFGESAGAGSVHHLILSPTTKGLFRKAIIQSGSAICPWSLGNPNNALELAQKLGCTSKDNKEILNFLQNVPVDQLFIGQNSIKNSNLMPSSVAPLLPVVENENAKDAFLTENPIDLLVSGRYNHVPIIFSFTNDEGEVFNFLSRQDINLELNVVPYWLKLKIGSAEYLKVARKIRKFYLKDGPDTNEDGNLTEDGKKLAADNCFIRGIIQSIKHHTKTSDQAIYLLSTSVSTKLGFLTHGKNKGVSHGDELGYEFLTPNSPTVEAGSIEDITRKRFVAIITNFAKKGDPNPEKISDLFPIKWEPVKNGDVKLLDIGEKLSMETNPEAEGMKLWDEIFQAYEHSKYY